MKRRDFLGLIPAAVLARSTGLACSRTARAADEQPGADNDVPMIGAESLTLLPDPLGEVQCLTFSPDGSQIAVVFRRPGRGSVVCIWPGELESEYKQLAQLPDAIQVYSVAWEPNGTRLALAVWDKKVGAPKPYQTCLYLIDAQAGNVGGRFVLWDELNPLDKGGLRLFLAWLNEQTFVATREGSAQLYEVSVRDPSLRAVYTFDAPDLRPFPFPSPPVRFDRDSVGIFFRWSSKLFVYSDGQVSEQRVGDGSLLCDRHLHNEVLFSKIAAYRGRFSKKSAQADGSTGELVALPSGRVLARLPSRSPFAPEVIDLTIRRGVSLSMQSRRLAILETDVDLPLPVPKQDKDRIRPRPVEMAVRRGSRLVVADLGPYLR